jgi:putative transposase
VVIHAYALMTNHVHLLASPLRADSLPKTLQSVGLRYVQRFNASYERTGTLWEGRYRASVIDSERYLLTCMRYIELNPVRAALVSRPVDYAWSSHSANALGVFDPLVRTHEVYDRLGPNTDDCRVAYRALFSSALAAPDVDAIREATHKNWALGSDEFRNHIECVSGRRAAPAKNGRPARRTIVSHENSV